MFWRFGKAVKKRPRSFEAPGPFKRWDGARHALFPKWPAFGALRFSQAAGSPTLFPAATRNQRSHSRTVEAIACLEVSSEASQHGSSGFCRSLCAAPGNQDIAATRHPRLLWTRSTSGFIKAGALALPYGSCLLSLRSPFDFAVSRCGFSHRLPCMSQHGLLEHQVNRPAPYSLRPFRAADAFLGGLPA